MGDDWPMAFHGTHICFFVIFVKRWVIINWDSQKDWRKEEKKKPIKREGMTDWLLKVLFVLKPEDLAYAEATQEKQIDNIKPHTFILTVKIQGFVIGILWSCTTVSSLLSDNWLLARQVGNNCGRFIGSELPQSTARQRFDNYLHDKRLYNTNTETILSVCNYYQD